MKLPAAFALAFCLLPGLRAGELGVDRGHSRIDIDVGVTAGSFTARVEDYRVAIVVGERVRRIEQARLDFAFSAVRTGKAARDAKMNRWQETELYPDVHYELATLDRGEAGRGAAHGLLTLHGVTRAVVFPVVVTTQGPLWAIDGEAAIDTRDFGLPVIRLAFMLRVDPVVKVRFHLQGTAPAAEPDAVPGSPAGPAD